MNSVQDQAFVIYQSVDFDYSRRSNNHPILHSLYAKHEIYSICLWTSFRGSPDSRIVGGVHNIRISIGSLNATQSICCNCSGSGYITGIPRSILIMNYASPHMWHNQHNLHLVCVSISHKSSDIGSPLKGDHLDSMSGTMGNYIYFLTAWYIPPTCDQSQTDISHKVLIVHTLSGINSQCQFRL